MRAPLLTALVALLPVACQSAGSAPAAAASSMSQAMFVLAKTPTWMGCAGSVRDALLDVPGVDGVDVTPNNPEIVVHYDAAKVQPPALLQALQQAGQAARAK